jgi:hypothetical protein
VDHNLSLSAYTATTGGTPSNSGNNTTAANLAAILFTDTATDDYSLQGGSPAKNAGSDGRDLGCHWSTLQTNTTGVVTG